MHVHYGHSTDQTHRQWTTLCNQRHLSATQHPWFQYWCRGRQHLGNHTHTHLDNHMSSDTYAREHMLSYTHATPSSQPTVDITHHSLPRTLITCTNSPHKTSKPLTSCREIGCIPACRGTLGEPTAGLLLCLSLQSEGRRQNREWGWARLSETIHKSLHTAARQQMQ